MLLDDVPPLPPFVRVYDYVAEEGRPLEGTQYLIDAGRHRWRVDHRGSIRAYIEYSRRGAANPWRRAWHY